MVAEKPHILIVEDDSDLAEMLSVYFRVQNYEVTTAGWGAEAVRLSQETPFQLAVLDIRLPDIDGYEVCRQIRARRQTQDLPIIFLTERSERVNKLQGLELGVVDYITKPFDVQELRLRVRNALNRAARQALLNPVTDLPEGEIVDERLSAALYSVDSWALLALALHNLGRFRELYGFVAADDVLRAVALTIRSAIREQNGDEEYFVGHTGPESFVISAPLAALTGIRERLEARLNQSWAYFYPARDRERLETEGGAGEMLRLSSAVLESSAGPFDTLAALRAALAAASA
ncbi:MAG: diguanylate cyclase [Chloroflexota bacterium]|nr:MAG: diguanylate cyclase [Chloroflexota bacterium]